MKNLQRMILRLNFVNIVQLNLSENSAKNETGD